MNQKSKNVEFNNTDVSTYQRHYIYQRLIKNSKGKQYVIETEEYYNKKTCVKNEKH